MVFIMLREVSLIESTIIYKGDLCCDGDTTSLRTFSLFHVDIY